MNRILLVIVLLAFASLACSVIDRVVIETENTVEDYQCQDNPCYNIMSGGKVQPMPTAYFVAYAGRSEGCHTYNVNSIFGGRDNQEAVFCGDSTPREADKHSFDPASSIEAIGIEVVADSTSIAPLTDSPIVTVPTIEDTTPPSDTPSNEDKVKCNAGRGNGSEGNPDCDPGKSGEHNHGGD